MALDGKGSFQDTSGMNGSLNAHALFTAVSVSCERITSASDIRDALPRAVAAASSGGPAVLLLPKDIQQALVSPPITIAITPGRQQYPGCRRVTRSNRAGSARGSRSSHDHRR